MRTGKKQTLDANARLGGTRRTPDSLKPKYNKRPCEYCGRPLGRTFNVRRHKNCVEKASHLIGIDYVNH